jgi:hypothetical protein
VVRYGSWAIRTCKQKTYSAVRLATSIESGNGGGNIGGLHSAPDTAVAVFDSGLGGGEGSFAAAAAATSAGAVVEGIGGGATGIMAVGAGVGVGVCRTLMFGDWEDGVVGTLSSGMVPALLRRTLVNLRLAGRYSHFKPTDSHLLHWGRSPEHLVFCEWHWLHARCARLRRVPASVRFCEGLILEILSFQMHASQQSYARIGEKSSREVRWRVATHQRTGPLHPRQRDK